jgi:hypothetical protein
MRVCMYMYVCMCVYMYVYVYIGTWATKRSFNISLEMRSSSWMNISKVCARCASFVSWCVFNPVRVKGVGGRCDIEEEGLIVS